MRFALAASAALAVLLRPAAAHFNINLLEGGTGGLRPIVLAAQNENFPVQGNAIISDDIICNTARPFSSYASSPVTVAAGGNLTVHWTNGPTDSTPIGAAHYGVCHVHIGQGLKPTGWTKIYETTPDNAGDWCLNIIANNKNNYVFTIPAELAPGQYVIRVQLPALHAAGQPGGAQFYVRCMDIVVTGSGTAVPPFANKIPGTWDLNTPGVLFDLYANNKNSAKGGDYKGYYPNWGGELWVPAKSAPSIPSSPTSVANSSPVPGKCQAKLNQCGGKTFTGITTCCSGSTCTYKSDYYSQCV